MNPPWAGYHTVILTFLVSMLTLAKNADAEFVEPGLGAQDFATTLQQDPKFGGTVEATKVLPFNVADDHGEQLAGEMLNEVVRDPRDGTLSFYYSVLNAPLNQTLAINVVNANDFQGEVTPGLLNDSPGNGGPLGVWDDYSSIVHFLYFPELPSGEQTHTFLLKTAATSFDDQGSTLINAFGITNGPPVHAVGGDMTISGTFRPLPRESPQAVPLPPAWTAIPTLLVVIHFGHKKGYAKESP